MMSNQYVIYKGKKFTLEWYYNSNNNSPARKYFMDLDREQRLDAFELFQLMADEGQILEKKWFNFEGNAIFAFKPRPNRFLCFFYTGKKVIVTNAFEKKQDKMPQREKEKALSYKKDYEIRNKHGEYYE